MVFIIFQLECCGVDNLTDWFYIPAWPDKANVPSSCCVNQSFGCGEANSDAAWYTRVSTLSHVSCPDLGPNYFAKVISRQQKSPLAGKELNIKQLVDTTFWLKP